MGNIFNEDFRDFIRQFNSYNVRYVLIGGYSVILHGYSRTTGDMDILVDRTPENYNRIKLAFLHFGMPVFDMTEENFLNHPQWEVFKFGKPPSSIDVMIKVKGLSFEECYNDSVFFEEEELQIRTINFNKLISAKRASGRSKDLNDLENLLP
ncbi:MAG TPA: DUF6036 family nucleotidyltransferase [Mucilaginibacter sp.]|jgi:hypothetical protein